MWVRDTTSLVKKKVFITGFVPYLYVPSTEAIPTEPWIVETLGGFLHMDGKPDIKIIATDPASVGNNRVKFKAPHEADVNYIQRLLIDTGILSCFYTPINTVVIPYTTIVPVNKIIQPRVVFIDIEVLSQGRFPNMRNPTQPVIAVTLHDSVYKKYYSICLDDRVFQQTHTQLEPDWDLVRVINARNLFDLTKQYLDNANPDIISGWNIKFDIDYFQAWAKAKFKETLDLSRCEIFDLLGAYKKIKSSLGNRLKEVVVKEDIIKAVNMVSDTFKIEMYTDKTQRDNFIKYNKKDVEYCVMLANGFKRVTDGKWIQYDIFRNFWGQKNFVGLANLEYTTSHIKRHDPLWLSTAHQLGFTLPTSYMSEDTEDLEFGGVVFTPSMGLYRKITVLDMSRYYPSILLSFPKETSPDIWGKLAPSVITYLSKERDFWDAEVKKYTPGTEEYKTAKVTQTNVKTFLSGAWGYFAFKGSRIYSKERGDFVLKTAGEGLNRVKDRAKKAGHDTIYGDSVIENSPTLILRNNRLDVVPIQDVKANDTTLTESGWTKVNKLIKKTVTKKMFRVETYDGVVEVTEDHSLIRSDGSPAKPREVSTGDILGEIKYSSLPKGTFYDSEIAWLLGYFCADGTAGDYRKTCNKVAVHIDGQQEDLLIRSKDILERKLHFDCKISSYPSNETSGGIVYRLNIHNPIKCGALEYFLMCYDSNHNKKIPELIFNADTNAISEFIDGFIYGDGSDKNKEKIMEFCKTELIMFGLHILYKIIGQKSRYMVYVGQRKSKQYLRKIRIVKNITDLRLHQDHEVKQITDLGIYSNVNVYDLETENHQFSSGGVLLHNTDSIFLGSTMEEVEGLVAEVNDELTLWAKEKGIVDSKFHIKEDRFASTTLFIKAKNSEEGAKKRYGQRIIRENNDPCDYILIKGFDYVRGNTSEVTRKLQKEVIDQILMDDTTKIISNIQKIMKDIATKEYDLDQITIPINLSKPFEKGIEVDGEYYDGAIWGNKYIGESIIGGDMVRYFKAKSCGNLPYNQWVAYLDADRVKKLGITPDYEWVVDRTLRSPLESILNAAGISWANIQGFENVDELFGD